MTQPEPTGEQKKLARKIEIASEEVRLAQEWLDSLVASCNHLGQPDEVCPICHSTIQGES